MKNLSLLLGVVLLSACGSSEQARVEKRGAQQVQANIAPVGSTSMPQTKATGAWSNSFQAFSDSMAADRRESQEKQNAHQQRMAAMAFQSDQESRASLQSRNLQRDLTEMLPVMGMLGMMAKVVNPSCPDKQTDRWVAQNQAIFDRAKKQAVNPMNSSLSK